MWCSRCAYIGQTLVHSIASLGWFLAVVLLNFCLNHSRDVSIAFRWLQRQRQGVNTGYSATRFQKPRLDLCGRGRRRAMGSEGERYMVNDPKKFGQTRLGIAYLFFCWDFSVQQCLGWPRKHPATYFLLTNNTTYSWWKSPPPFE